MAKRTSRFGRLAACALATLLVIPALPSAQAATDNHYHFQASSSATNNHAVFSSALDSVKGSNTTSTGYYASNGTLYLPEGSQSAGYIHGVLNSVMPTDDMTEEMNHGLPFRTYEYSYSAGNGYSAGTTYYKVVDGNLWLELDLNAQTAGALNTAGLGAVNLSLVCPVNAATPNNSSVGHDRQLLVEVSIDGETWLDGTVGVRSSTLVGGGKISNNTPDAFYFRIETDNLLDIPGMTGSTIQKLRIWPNGKEARSVGTFYLNTLDVNTWTDAASFAKDVPADITYTKVDESILRQIAVDEAERTAITYETKENIVVPAAKSGGSTKDEETYETIYAGTYTGPVYKRGNTHTREMLQSVIDEDGMYTGGHGILAADSLTVETDDAIGMDCQTFVYNAISRVSRTNAWSVFNTPMATRTVLLGDLTTHHHPAFTDRDIVDYEVDGIGQNTEQDMYENYAAAKPGDVVITCKADRIHSVHTRLVAEVHTVRNSDDSIDPEQSYMLCHEQTSAKVEVDGAYSRLDQKYTFAQLLGDKYVAYTLTEYADGQVEDVNVQVVAGATTEDDDFRGGVNVAVTSNYRIISYQITLEDLVNGGDPLFDSGLVYVEKYNLRGLNFQNEDLDATLAARTHDGFAIKVAVDSGPLTSLEQDGTVPHIVRSITLNNTYHNHNCEHTHADSFDSNEGWTPLSSITSSMAGTIDLMSGNYYLDTNVSLTNGFLRIQDGGTVNLCLNGYALYGADGWDYILNVKGSGSVLNICDCSSDQSGTIGEGWKGKGGATYFPAIMVNGTDGCEFNLYGGAITGIENNGPVVYVKGGSQFNMYGGAITDNVVTFADGSGAVYLAAKNVFTMTGGKIGSNQVTSTQQISGTGMGTVSIGGTAVLEGYHAHDCGMADCPMAAISGWNEAWKPLSSIVEADTAGQVDLPEGSYYLDKSIQLRDSAVLHTTGTVNIDLNGKTLTAPQNSSHVFYTEDGNTLNICDSGESGIITGVNKSSDTTGTSAAILVRGGSTVNLYGGTITGNESRAAIFITGNSNAGTSAFYLKGGDITGNVTAKDGAVYLANAYAAFHMTGGSVEQNDTPDGIGQVSGNSSANVTVAEGLNPTWYHAHTDGCGHSAIPAWNWLPLSSLTDGEYTDNVALPAGNYYLDKDIGLDSREALMPDKNTTVNLCLNGKTLTAASDENNVIYMNGSTLNICDCGENGTITGLTGTATTSSVILVRAGSTVNLFAGTITGNSAKAVVSVFGKEADGADSIFNMTGGAIVGNTATEYAGIYTNSTYSVANVTGGTVNNTVPAGKGQVGGSGTNITSDPDHPTHNCSHDHADWSDVAWKPFSSVTASMTNGMAIDTGYYYLDADITLTGYLKVNADVTLCLNGHNIIGKDKAGYMFLMDASNATFNICDCSPAQSGTMGKGWSSASSATATTDRTYSVIRIGNMNDVGNKVCLYGGSITGATSGSTIYINPNNSFYAYGGAVYDNTYRQGTDPINRNNTSNCIIEIRGGEFDMTKSTLADSFVPTDTHTVIDTNNTDRPYRVVRDLSLAGVVVNSESSLAATIQLSDLTASELDDYKAVITKAYHYGDETKNTAATQAGKVEGRLDQLAVQDATLSYALTFPNISAKEMGDEITVAFYTADGLTVSTQTFTLADQLMALVEKEGVDAYTLALCTDALHYGGAAQERFGYRTDALVNADMDAQEEREVNWTNSQSVVRGDGAKYATTVSLTDKLELNMYFNMDYDSVAAITVADINGNSVGYTAHKIVSKDGSSSILRVCVDSLAVKDAKTLIRCTVESTEGTIEVVDSLESYVARSSSVNDRTVLNALKLYVESAITLAAQAG